MLKWIHGIFDNHNASMDCYCAFCRHPRKVYSKRTMNLVNIFWCVASTAVMLALYGSLDPRFFVIFIVSIIFVNVL